MYSTILLTILGTISPLGFVSARLNQTASASKGSWPTLDKKPTVLMAHRGEKILMPQHTLGSYEMACIEYADYVEPDLLLTKDRHLVCYHDLTLKDGTDVASRPEFAHLMKNYTGYVDGNNVSTTFTEDWFVRDFLLAELQTLFVVQAVIGIRPQYFNKLFHIPTFQEYLDVIHEMAFKQNRTIGIIPEIKNPIFNNQNHSEHYQENTILKILNSYGYPMTKQSVPNCIYVNKTDLTVNSITCGNLIIQSFDMNSLIYVKTQTDVDLMMLGDETFAYRFTYNGIKEIANVARYFCVWKELLYTGIEAVVLAENLTDLYDREIIASMGGFVPPQQLVETGHDLNLLMGLFVIYDSHEPSLRGCAIKCDPEDKRKEMFFYFAMGMDAMFIENVQEAIELRMKYDCILNSGNRNGSRKYNTNIWRPGSDETSTT